MISSIFCFPINTHLSLIFIFWLAGENTNPPTLIFARKNPQELFIKSLDESNTTIFNGRLDVKHCGNSYNFHPMLHGSDGSEC